MCILSLFYIESEHHIYYPNTYFTATTVSHILLVKIPISDYRFGVFVPLIPEHSTTAKCENNQVVSNDLLCNDNNEHF